MFPRLRVGVIGTGFVGRIHAHAARKAGAELVGVAASTQNRGVRAAVDLGAGEAFATAAELATDPRLDVVHVCTPNYLHLELAQLAIEAGKHVVCEKPLATSATDARALAQAAERAGVVAAVPFVYRFHPMVREARARILSGAIGRVTLLHGSYLQDWLLGETDTNWRVSAELGGASRAYADIGSHWCDLAEWLTGHRVTELVSTTQSTVTERPVGGSPTFSNGDGSRESRPVDTEDIACLLFRTDRGALGSLTVSQVAAGRKNRLWIEVDGTAASVAFDQEDSEKLWVGSREASQLLLRDPGTLSEAARPYAVLPAGHAQGFNDCFGTFVSDVYSSIERGELADGLPTFVDGLRAAQIAEAVLDAEDKRAWVEV